MHHYEKLYIDGKWVACAGHEHIEVVCPSTEEVLGSIPAGTAEDADRAVQAAQRALESWANTAVSERAAFLGRLHQGLLRRGDELAETITGEVGMPLKMSRAIQVGLPSAVMASYATLALEFPFEEQIGNSLVLKEPAGVVACITPWNYPLHQIVAKVAPALAAGCTVVLKPSEVAPFNAFILAEIVDEAKLPAGVFNLVSGLGSVVGEALSAHAGVEMVSFTGSTTAGRRVGHNASQSVKKVSLELGGKSASLILDDADLAMAVKATVNGCFLNSGQTCNALTRMLVPESRYQEAAALAVQLAQGFTVGDPFGGEAKLGPLISEAQRERVRSYIRKGIEEGAELLVGGAEPPEGLKRGYYVQPTLFGRVAPDSTLAQEEIFGPVLSIICYRDEEDAVRIANGTPYGLAAAVWSGDQERALRVARRLRAGQVDVNGGRFNAMAPFGGIKQSGHGRELGRYGLEEFLVPKSLQL
ncbi:aldehyde dehydrogenase family protein [Geomonas sp.]|uniref:aldehyde dehydrogenase family protein n=1 Tax=Geomonas sp. TaxID=2651584 RepID=UPI002B4939B8|nr:aldehyde dehydrogenase family protein [Geomonas sp.]HJV34758.1 aldehyde dehydrogenase family protein [Geomonas sp.]